mgnify:CR=1 FL=1
MRGKLFLIGCLLLTVILAACHYRIAETVVPLWLHQLPLTDSIPVCRDDELVVAEISVHSEDTIGQRWVKVARDQSTIGWVREKDLLKEVVPVDPISQCIHWFSSSHALPFFIILGVFFLAYAYRAVHRKQIRLIWLNDIDSVFPITLSWLMAAAATLYNSLQHFVPETWERYYYNPTLNPFELPFIFHHQRGADPAGISGIARRSFPSDFAGGCLLLSGRSGSLLHFPLYLFHDGLDLAGLSLLCGLHSLVCVPSSEIGSLSLCLRSLWRENADKRSLSALWCHQ